MPPIQEGHMKIKLLFSLLVFSLSLSLIYGCNSTIQPTQTVIAPIATTPTPTFFSVSNLSVRPANPSKYCDIYHLVSDQEIIVSVTVTNFSSVYGDHDVTLYVERGKIETKSIALAPGESRDVEFYLLGGEYQDGFHIVTIEGLKGYFGVG